MELTDIWPPYQLRITIADLELRVVRDEDLPGLVDLALSGVHPTNEMPFGVPWTRTSPDKLPAAYARHHWQTRSVFTPENFNLEFAVRRNGFLVGSQGVGAQDFPVTRSAGTGSWLALAHHGQGIGTRMRRAVCALAFDELHAAEVVSSPYVDNPSSLAVSRKVGYLDNGSQIHDREGKPATLQRLLLTPAAFIRGNDPITITGAEALRRFLGLDG